MEHNKYAITQELQRPLAEKEQVHHIDGNKHNNRITNLLLCENAKTHRDIHHQMEFLIYELVARKVVRFNQLIGRYEYVTRKTRTQTKETGGKERDIW